MTDTEVADQPQPPLNSTASAVDDFSGLPIPPMDLEFLSQDEAYGVVLDDLGLAIDFSLDELLSASLDPGPTLSDPGQIDSDCFALSGSEPNLTQFTPDRSLLNVSRAFKKTSLEFPHISGEHGCGDGGNSNSFSSLVPEISQISGDQVPGGQDWGSNQFSGDRGQDVSAYLNVPSPESEGSKGSNNSRILNCPSPESQVSGNCGYDVSEEDSNKSVNSSPNFGNLSVKNDVSAHSIKFQEWNNPYLKRKMETEDLSNSDSRTSKSRKWHCELANDVNDTNNNVVLTEEDEKRRARLIRNRESAQLSRQRKKHYVEELEDKVRHMGSTIQDLNSQIAYIMAQNSTLRQQLGGGTMVPRPMAPSPPSMYAPMMYPWMPCAVPPYMVKPQGSQVPLVPIPRLKPQKIVSAPKVSKKAEIKKSEGKTKKVASISLLGLLFFILLFGGLVPMVNVRHHGRVLFNETNSGRDFVNNRHHSRGHGGELNMDTGKDDSVNLANRTEPLVASLYVPRNNKLVKIDGNLIINSVLASERAMASHEGPALVGSETSLAVPGDLAPLFPSSDGKHAHRPRNPTEQQRALPSASAKDGLRSKAADGRLQQWFREGLAGPILSSGMCTEVFQFDVSSAIVPATPKRNVSKEQHKNSTNLNRGRNRRILYGLPGPLPGSSSHNISDDHAESSQKENLKGNNSLSSMVVSVLVDPREMNDVEGNGVMGHKSLPQVFVVVLIDSVKYVTYSCMLPFKGAGPHLVTT